MAVAAVTLLVGVWWVRSERPTASGDPATLIAAFVADLRPDDPYRDPTEEDRQLAANAVGRLVNDVVHGASLPEMTSLGFSSIASTDPVTGRAFALFRSETDTDRSWGAVLVDRSAPTRLVIEVPHPNFDLRTELLGVEMFRKIPGSIVLVAGAHRRASDGNADVAHNESSLFHAMAVELARRGLPQIQLHGFADKNLRDADVVVSTGSATRLRAARSIADQLAEAGLIVCRAWLRRCGQLEGTSNVQGRAAEKLGATFVHLEISWSVRRGRTGRSTLVDAVAAAGIASSD